MRKFLASKAQVFGISGIEFEGCYYMTFRMERGDAHSLLGYLHDHVSSFAIDTHALVSPRELPLFEKYDRYIPAELLRYAYAEDRLNAKEMTERIKDMANDADASRI